MQAVGMIAEFNPLHNGHVHALAEARRRANADVVVVAMSGNFVQRGEPAILDKWARAKAALQCGADLVVELPVFDAVQAAPQFATGGVAIMQALGVSSLAFGTEAADVDYARAAERLQSAKFDASGFQDFTQTYATQLNQQYREATGLDLSQPNLLLGMSYAQANLQLQAGLKLLAIPRVGVDHDAQHVASQFASASHLRELITSGQPVNEWMPEASVTSLSSPHYDWSQLFPLLKYRLLTASLSELEQISGMSEGLQYRLSQQIKGQQSFDDFMTAIKSKRYTYARLRRLCLNVVLNLTQAQVDAAQQHRFLHVLGFTQAGQAYLHQVKKSVGLPLIVKPTADQLTPKGLMAVQQQADNLITFLGAPDQNYGRVPYRF
ncbi:nucleotidyltransferase [Lacticaseibacillus porcinae]|uniref:nucleotidyltransferase n=1 Tax=Lacticaseibacillus porcinae TaxID=1123687 RepID=UPI000F76EA9E|nr:nucleotidyltransferase [Lacticaseibacillus porcinae]